MKNRLINKMSVDQITHIGYSHEITLKKYIYDIASVCCVIPEKIVFKIFFKICFYTF